MTGPLFAIRVVELKMYTLAEDEKLTTVMAYTQNALYRGEAIHKVSVTRVSVWLRSQGAPEYLHLLKTQVLIFGSGTIKNLNCPEIYVPRAEVIGFHIAPPAADPLDYEGDEKNRSTIPVTGLVGTFQFAGKLRVSSHTGLTNSLENSRTAWISMYEVSVSNPYLPQMTMQVPMLLLNPSKVSFVPA